MTGNFAFFHPAVACIPRDIDESGWLEHGPFAFFLMQAVKPRNFVELGTHRGFSYFCFCQAREDLGLNGCCYAVDTWQGDEHAGFYDDAVFESVAARNQKYASFSVLIRSTFGGAVEKFADGSIDLLHVDGRHFYEDVKGDFEAYLPKLAPDAVVLFHDTAAHRSGFGVWRFFAELKQRHPAFEFLHGNGLGVIAMGRTPTELKPFFEADAAEQAAYRSLYAALGSSITERWRSKNFESGFRAAREEASAARTAEQACARELQTFKADLVRLNEEISRLNGHLNQCKQRLPSSKVRFAALWRYPFSSARRKRYSSDRLEEFVAPNTKSLRLAAIWRHPFSRLKQQRFLAERLADAQPEEQHLRNLPLVQRQLQEETPPPDRYIYLPLSGLAADAAAPRIGVMLHCFYTDMLGEIVDALCNIPWPFHVIVTTDSEAKRAPITAKLDRLTRASYEIVITPNRGRDVAPRLVALRDRYKEFGLVLHLHTKKSKHDKSLKGWMTQILGDLLGSPDIVRSIAVLFETDPRLGILAPRYFDLVRPHVNWTINFDRCVAHARRMGICLEAKTPIEFPAGSMFWLRPAALEPLLSIDHEYEDFEPERGQKDGTLAHVIERLLFYSAEAAGLEWRFVGAGAPTRAGENAVCAKPTERLDELLRLTWRQLTHPLANDPKQDFRARCALKLSAYLETGRVIAMPTSESPVVSIIVVSHNAAELTFEHLITLKRALDVPSEIIIVDNASSDDTPELLSRVTGARVIYNDENLHFLRAVNQGAALACGEMLLLLNNDTRVCPGAIGLAVDILRSDASIGAVGGKIVLLDGTMQEAGSIIFDDGACLGYGRGRNPNLPEFNFQREVDYCSGAFMMMPRGLFEAMGRLDEAFAPAYYEETDLSMRLRAAGYRIVFEPRIEISHFEFGSSASSETALALQARNFNIFRERHAQALSLFHYPHGAPAALIRNSSANRRMLVIDDRIPYPALGAGYPRAAELLRTIVSEGWDVTFFPLICPLDDLSVARAEFGVHIEFATGHGRDGLAAFLRERSGCYDALFVSRPHNMEIVQKSIKAIPDFLAKCALIYDAEAIFAEREAVRRLIKGTPFTPEEYQTAISAEMALASGAAVVTTVSASEQALFEERLGRGQIMPRVVKLGHALRPSPTQNVFDQRSNLLFVGALNGSSETSPNIDSLIWFVRDVMPKLDQIVGKGYHLVVAGRVESPEVEALAGPRVELSGMTPQLGPLYEAARVFVAPTRFAAGVPHKVHEAAAYGVPCVVTPLLAAQLGWTDGVEVLLGETAEGFAQACARLLQDGEIWYQVRANAIAQLKRDCDPGQFAADVRETFSQVEILDPVRRRRSERTPIALPTDDCVG